jgi:hypothetical protein
MLWVQRALASVPAIAGFSLLIACASAPETDAATGGEAPPTSATQDAAVVVVAGGNQSKCNGILVAPNVVLTALHCVALSGSGGIFFRCTASGSTALPDPNMYSSIGRPLEPSTIRVFMVEDGETPAAFGREVFGTGSLTICKDDVALVVLDRDLPVAGLPMRLRRPMKAQEALTAIGVANTELGRGVIRDDELHVEAVGLDEMTSGDVVVPPRMFLVEEGPCVAGTGGPALSKETGAVVGVHSRYLIGLGCDLGARTLFAKVAPYAELIERAFASAGRAPRLE